MPRNTTTKTTASRRKAAEPVTFAGLLADMDRLGEMLRGVEENIARAVREREARLSSPAQRAADDAALKEYAARQAERRRPRLRGLAGIQQSAKRALAIIDKVERRSA